jgi:hypothetical protein
MLDCDGFRGLLISIKSLFNGPDSPARAILRYILVIPRLNANCAVAVVFP